MRGLYLHGCMESLFSQAGLYPQSVIFYVEAKILLSNNATQEIKDYHLSYVKSLGILLR